MIKRAKEVIDYPDTVIPNYTARYFAKFILELHSDNIKLKKEIIKLKEKTETYLIDKKCDALIIDNLRQQLHLMNDLKKAAIDYVHCEKVPVEPQHEQWMIKMEKLEAICHAVVKLIERTQNNEPTKEE